MTSGQKFLLKFLAHMLSAAILPALAMDCPEPPQQVSKDTKAAVEVAVGRIGPLKAAESSVVVNRTTVDLLKSIPRADHLYLEQMMFAAYCTSIRDAKGMSDAEKARSVREYAREVRQALEAQDRRNPRSPPPGTPPPGKTSENRKSEAAPTSKRLEDDFLAYETQRKINGSSQFFSTYAPLRYRSWLSDANAGNPKAQVLVAVSLLRGDGVEKHPAEAISWLQKAADLGEPAAYFNLAWAAEEGLGIKKDLNAARIFYQEAAKRQHSGAMNSIGLYYRWGNAGLNQNSSEAVSWLQRAAQQGEAHAANDLGNLYEYGAPGVEKDPLRSAEWYQTAARMGHFEARGMLASKQLSSAIETYTNPNTTPADQGRAVSTSKLAMRDLEYVDVAALVEALGHYSLQTAIESVRQKGPDDAMSREIERAVSILIDKFRKAPASLRKKIFPRFSTLTQKSLSKKAEMGQHREVHDICKDALEDIDISTPIEGEQDGTIRLASTCAVSMITLGYRHEATQVANAAFKIAEQLRNSKPWDWYAFDAERNLGWNVGAAFLEVGDLARSQEYLKRAWNNAFSLFGRNSMTDRYRSLPLKGDLPPGVLQEDKEFFASFAKGGTSKAFMSRLKIPIDFNGTKVDFFVYIVSGSQGYRELQNQFIWVAEYRGGKVSSEILDLFRKLNKISVDKNYDFRELCVKALEG